MGDSTKSRSTGGGDYTTHIVTPLVFSSKSTGTNNSRQRGQEAPIPVQIINPVGNFGIGVPLFTKRNAREDENRFNMHTVVISGPENELADKKKLLKLLISFILVAVINFVATCVLYWYPNSVDISKVLSATPQNANQLAFVEIDESRSQGEATLFIATLVNICIGIVSAVFKQPLGLATYVLIVILVFFLGFTSIPYFFYSMRYTLDALQAYLALELIKNLSVNFLKIHS
jgi:magnesium-transporting ATPase (P-type)